MYNESKEVAPIEYQMLNVCVLSPLREGKMNTFWVRKKSTCFPKQDQQELSDWWKVGPTDILLIEKKTQL